MHASLGVDLGVNLPSSTSAVLPLLDSNSVNGHKLDKSGVLVDIQDADFFWEKPPFHIMPQESPSLQSVENGEFKVRIYKST